MLSVNYIKFPRKVSKVKWPVHTVTLGEAAKNKFVIPGALSIHFNYFKSAFRFGGCADFVIYFN